MQTNADDSGPESGRIYFPQLDGLRCLAWFLVLLHHTNLPAVIPDAIHQYGWIGVDLFFVLSAFLLTHLLKAEYGKFGSISVRKYFLRRVLRIFPLHYSFVTTMLLIVLVMNPLAITVFFGNWLSHIAFFNNILLALTGYTRALPYTMHLWTISFEEQFYFIVPFALPVLFAKGLKARNGLRLFAFLWIVLIVLRSVCVYLEAEHPFIWALPLRADALVLGTALGLGFMDQGLRHRPNASVFLVGVALLCLGGFMPSVSLSGWHQVFIYSIVDFGCVLVVAGLLDPSVFAWVLSTRVLRYLGKISFGLYVFHTLAISFGNDLAKYFSLDGSAGELALVVVLNIAMATASYQLFEVRFLRLKERFNMIRSRDA